MARNGVFMISTGNSKANDIQQQCSNRQEKQADRFAAIIARDRNYADKI